MAGGRASTYSEETATVEIYALIDPRTGVVRYIGKANNSAVKFKSHLRETRRRTPVYAWIAKLRVLGLVPVLNVIAICGEKDWQEAERREIKKAREAGGDLLNVADGGDQPCCPREVNARNGKINSQTRVDTPEKARTYELKQRIGLLLKAGCVNDRAKNKLRLAAQKRPELFGGWASL